MMISRRFLVLTAIILIAAASAAGWIYSRERAGNDESLVISYDGKEKISYSLSDIMDMESSTAYADIRSGKGDDERGDYTGVMLDELLEASDIGEFETVIFTAGDGYSSAADSEETGDIMIVYEKDGETLGYYTKGGTGPLRCIMLEDTYGNRSIKYLTGINCIQ